MANQGDATDVIAWGFVIAGLLSIYAGFKNKSAWKFAVNEVAKGTGRGPVYSDESLNHWAQYSYTNTQTGQSEVTPATASESAFVSEAEHFIGDPYVFGAAGPNEFDCSGLVQYAAEQIGMQGVPRTSEAQWSWTTHISESELQPGDLIFEQWPGDDQAPPGHVIIYIGNNQVIEAPQPGQNVHIRSWSPTETDIIGYGRIPGLS